MPAGHAAALSRSKKLLLIMPDFSNQFTRVTESRLGAFNFNRFNPPANMDELEERGPIELDNGAVYLGQWNKLTGCREGMGT